MQLCQHRSVIWPSPVCQWFSEKLLLKVEFNGEKRDCIAYIWWVAVPSVGCCKGEGAEPAKRGDLWIGGNDVAGGPKVMG